MANPFDDPDGRFLVLVNDEGQYSLWPVAITLIPAGWTVAHQEDDRRACLDFVNEHWTDMRPKSLIQRMTEAEASGAASGVSSTG
jgi:MbtH protein